MSIILITYTNTLYDSVTNKNINDSVFLIMDEEEEGWEEAQATTISSLEAMEGRPHTDWTQEEINSVPLIYDETIRGVSNISVREITQEYLERIINNEVNPITGELI